MKRCTLCNNIMSDDSQKCSKCGRNLDVDFVYICNRCGEQKAETLEKLAYP